MESENTPVKEEVVFTTETGLKAKAVLIDGKLDSVKMLTKVPKRFYYSCLNEVGITAEERFPTK